ncbi:DUF4293 domain-containing protein [Pedobacter psychroterrae]|uniref:DUF4293 family protein n=1 Tax=Pedobacter psychroterrae TaxID=2530453 RepID=A0A4V2MLX5_9SPHI|nr:DUF4293 domain-containing protein [Pedobacter psychroterrae]TCD03697.1 DUF4293 family protein [Pedobacter psychroterrae]
MIQRVQSIWLVLAVITLICMFFLPLLSKNVNGVVHGIYTSGLLTDIQTESASSYVVRYAFVPITLNLAAAILCFAAIFFFKNRKLQKGIILVANFVIAALAVICFYSGQQLPGGLNGASIAAGTFLPLVALVFNLLAIRGIRKDEQLLRSADRLR